LSHSLMASSITIMMSFMYGLAEASVYSVYALVSEALNLVTTSLYSSFAPSFGNFYAQENDERSAKIFSTFQYIFVMFSTFLMMCMLFTVVPFVRIYTSGATDIDYANYNLAIIMAVAGIFSAYRIPYNIIVSSCGYFKETWLQPVISVVVCIGLAIGLGFVDYSLVLVGLMTFFAINFIYQHFRLKLLVPHMIHGSAFILFGISIVGISLTVMINQLFQFPEGVIAWFVCALVYAVITILYIVTASLLFVRKQFIDSIKYINTLITMRR
jgi:O-antigen/teichoic acid export membrane protein